MTLVLMKESTPKSKSKGTTDHTKLWKSIQITDKPIEDIL